MKLPPRRNKVGDTQARYAIQRRRQLIVLLVAAATILIASVLLAGPRNVLLPHWWRIDLP